METIYLNNWKFSLAPHKEAWLSDYDDRDWEAVIVPHDWAVSRPFSRDHSSGTGYLPGGTGWYRRVFSVSSPVGGSQKVFINFDGVYKNSQVWCNGHYLGKRPFGYAGFRYDISHCVHEGDDNIVTVKVSHEDIGDSRWYTGSGIYRRVYLQFHGSPFIPQDSIVVQTETGKDKAWVTVSARIEGAAERFRVIASLSEDSGAGKSYHAEARPAGDAFSLRIQVDNPKTWSPETLDLYQLNLELRGDKDESIFRAMPINVGIRTIKFDPDAGFFINGVNQKIRGVCLHHDAGCLGAAVWPEVWRRRLEKLKLMGCNAIRTSHNPHMGELYDLCDEMGFFVMDEAFDEWEGCKNKWTRGHNVYPPVHQGYAEDFPQWHERDLADMVIRDRNHPCVIMWSIGNEIDYPNDPYVHPLFAEMMGNNDSKKPKAEMLYNPGKPNMERLAVVAAELTAIVKRHDRTRPVLTAAAFPELSSRIGFFDSLDMVGYNYKEQFYEEDHKRFPHLPIIGSENHHGLEAWKAVKDKPYISGQFLWTGIDYLGEARGWPIRGSGAGLLDIAGNEKIAYYRRKALWSEKPLLFLASRLDTEGADGKTRPIQPWELSRSWDYAPGSAVQVICYTNLAEAELFCNGKSRGTQRRGEESEYLAWIVPFERGKLEVRGTAGAADRMESTLPAVTLRLREWKSAAVEKYPAKGKYRVAQIEAELLDEEGRLCPAADHLVHVSLAGPGKLLGLENGDLADCTEYAAPARRACRGRLIIYALIEGEGATVTALVEGMPLAVLNI
jgi:hypothetical protein